MNTSRVMIVLGAVDVNREVELLGGRSYKMLECSARKGGKCFQQKDMEFC